MVFNMWILHGVLLAYCTNTPICVRIVLECFVFAFILFGELWKSELGVRVALLLLFLFY